MYRGDEAYVLNLLNRIRRQEGEERDAGVLPSVRCVCVGVWKIRREKWLACCTAVCDCRAVARFTHSSINSLFFPILSMNLISVLPSQSPSPGMNC